MIKLSQQECCRETEEQGGGEEGKRERERERDHRELIILINNHIE